MAYDMRLAVTKYTTPCPLRLSVASLYHIVSPLCCVLLVLHCPPTLSSNVLDLVPQKERKQTTQGRDGRTALFFEL